MPSYWKGKTSLSVWISEDLKYQLAVIADELGYATLSSFIEDILKEAIAAAEVTKALKYPPHARRKLILESVFQKIVTKLRFK